LLLSIGHGTDVKKRKVYVDEYHGLYEVYEKTSPQRSNVNQVLLIKPSASPQAISLSTSHQPLHKPSASPQAISLSTSHHSLCPRSQSGLSLLSPFPKWLLLRVYGVSLRLALFNQLTEYDLSNMINSQPGADRVIDIKEMISVI
jgi:hypothetical protein